MTIQLFSVVLLDNCDVTPQIVEFLLHHTFRVKVVCQL